MRAEPMTCVLCADRLEDKRFIRSQRTGEVVCEACIEISAKRLRDHALVRALRPEALVAVVVPVKV
jgi:hypothetical protein